MKAMNKRLAELETAAKSAGRRHLVWKHFGWNEELVLDHYGREKIGPNESSSAGAETIPCRTRPATSILTGVGLSCARSMGSRIRIMGDGTGTWKRAAGAMWRRNRDEEARVAPCEAGIGVSP